MCRTSQALYVWCHCEEVHILETCESGRLSPTGSCDLVPSDTVYLQCFCYYHSTRGFTSMHKDQNLQKKAEKKKNKRRSMMSTASTGTVNSRSTTPSSLSSVMEKSSNRWRRSWNHIRKLSYDFH